MNRITSLLICVFSILCISFATDENTCDQNQQFVQNGNNVCRMFYNQCNQNSDIQITTCLSVRCKFQIGGSCIYYLYQPLDQVRCMRDCCALFKPPGQSYTNQEVSNCLNLSVLPPPSSPKPPQNKLAIILGSVLGVVFIIFLTIFFCCRNSIGNCWAPRIEQSLTVINNKPPINDLIEIQTNQINFILEQTNQNLEIKYDNEEECTICLSSSTQIRTKCGHWFHLKCLSSWLTKNYKCPNCVSQDISPVKIMCKSCQKPYAQMKMNKKNSWKHLKKQLNNLRCKMCNQK